MRTYYPYIKKETYTLSYTNKDAYAIPIHKQRDVHTARIETETLKLNADRQADYIKTMNALRNVHILEPVATVRTPDIDPALPDCGLIPSACPLISLQVKVYN